MKRSIKPLHILITAGGTREYIDPVRFISNASSGRMGYALARAAVRAGHKVTLIAAPTALKPPKRATVIQVVTSGDMFSAVKCEFERCDCLLMAAAVSDYKPARISRTKIKKEQTVLSLDLKPTTDILKWAGKHKRSGQILVGFALEDTGVKKNAEKKLASKNLDMIIANEPSAIGAGKSSIHIKSRTADWQTLPICSKTASAREIIRQIELCRIGL
ncbi:MAG: phosphopantothenoylcysteine decarboxylase [Planctomycetales bacterium]|nr:phosphopantothenoylcysteine decarboxylase [Planctomycetales bacterium]